MADPWSKTERGIESPVESAEPISPDDDNDLPNSTRAIWVGVEGDLELVMSEGQQTVVFKNVPVGLWPFRATRVKETNTTATELIACW